MTDLASCFRDLNQKERIYVESRLAGMSQVASGRAAGIANPEKEASKWEKKPHVQAAIIAATEIFAQEVGFTRKDAHDMLMQAYYNADTAGEQIAAVRELIKLHGVAAPEKIEHEHTHKHEMQLEHMPLKELMKLAGSEDLTLEGEFERVPEEQKQLEMDVGTDEQEGTAEISS